MGIPGPECAPRPHPTPTQCTYVARADRGAACAVRQTRTLARHSNNTAPAFRLRRYDVDHSYRYLEGKNGRAGAKFLGRQSPSQMPAPYAQHLLPDLGNTSKASPRIHTWHACAAPRKRRRAEARPVLGRSRTSAMVPRNRTRTRSRRGAWPTGKTRRPRRRGLCRACAASRARQWRVSLALPACCRAQWRAARSSLIAPRRGRAVAAPPRSRGWPPPSFAAAAACRAGQRRAQDRAGARQPVAHHVAHAVARPARVERSRRGHGGGHAWRAARHGTSGPTRGARGGGTGRGHGERSLGAA